jgi:hypothetical protein
LTVDVRVCTLLSRYDRQQQQSYKVHQWNKHEENRPAWEANVVKPSLDYSRFC